MSDRRFPVVFLDPGHGGHEPAGRSSPDGARGPGGTAEKDVTLALARSVALHLGGARLTRDGDLNLPLGERIERARRGGADVFLSLHASGPGRTARAFAHERGSARSHALAASLGRQLTGFGGGAIAHAGDLAVLAPDRHAPHTAACLLEVDDISDASGEARLRDPHALDALGRSIADAIRRFGAVTDDPGLAQAIESELRVQLDAERLCAAMIAAADELQGPNDEAPRNYAGRGYGQQPGQQPDPPPPRPGTPGDLMRAILLFPPVQLTLRRVGDDAVNRFRLMSPGETTLVLTWTVPIAAGVVYGVYRTPALWSPAASALTWGVNQGIHRFSPDLNVNFSASPSAWSLGLTFDLAPTLRRAGLPF
ncbi:MAG TPA: N-acetylmuramoyl-L-alanine amidase [Kofleriaceae bacterium]|nr:N-acetylmuramoyl-L-alanine amidase [Kofleriaceae bacterium]